MSRAWRVTVAQTQLGTGALSSQCARRLADERGCRTVRRPTWREDALRRKPAASMARNHRARFVIRRWIGMIEQIKIALYASSAGYCRFCSRRSRTALARRCVTRLLFREQRCFRHGANTMRGVFRLATWRCAPRSKLTAHGRLGMLTATS